MREPINALDLELSCTGLSNVVLNGIEEVGLSTMLLCNICFEKYERDNIIRTRTKHKANKQVKTLKNENNVESFPVKLTWLINKKDRKILKVSCNPKQL